MGSPTVVAFKSSYAQNVSSSFGSIQVELHRIVVMKVEMCELRRVVELDLVLPTLPNFLKLNWNILVHYSNQFGKISQSVKTEKKIGNTDWMVLTTYPRFCKILYFIGNAEMKLKLVLHLVALYVLVICNSTQNITAIRN